MAIISSAQVQVLELDPSTLWVFVTLRSEGTLAGMGEAMLNGQEPLLKRALELAAQKLVGLDVEQASLPQPALAPDKATGLLEATVHAALDQALWDLRAQLVDLPLYRLLGPVRRKSVELYANINRGTRERSPEGFATRAKAACGAGFEAVKIAPFDGFTRANANTRQGRNAYAMAVERVRAVRDAIGMDNRLMIDCHCRFHLSGALSFLQQTESLRIDWFEDVLPYRDLDGWSHLKSASSAPLIGGESARGTSDLMPFLDRGIWDVVMPDIRFFGGVTELLALTPLAAQYQVAIAPHNPRGPVATLASAHVMASCPVFDHLEFQFDEIDWRSDLTKASEHIVGNQLQLSSAPGLGLSWNAELAESHAVMRD